MDPGGVVIRQSLMVHHRLHPIAEDESEGLGSRSGREDTRSIEEQVILPLEHNSDEPELDDETSIQKTSSLVASMNKVICSMSPSGESHVSDFIHINDCLKEESRNVSDLTDAVISDLPLQLVMVRKGKADAQLQAELRKRLRLLENDSKDVAAVFCELSARLLSIESDKDLVTVTFRTFEEVWKFSTYYSLGFLNHCMENIFLDQTFWLTSLEDEGAGLKVLVNDEMLSRIYKGLLMEEGAYYARCADSVIRQATIVDNSVQIIQSSSAAQRHRPGWIHQDSSTGEEVSVKAEVEPLCPFHQ